MNYPRKVYSNFKNKYSIFYWGIFLFLLLSCTNRSIRIESDEAFNKSDYCSGNEENSYEIYIPSGSAKCGQLPQLIILDSHGKGKAAIDLFIPSAEKYKFILIASNQIKNNTPDYVAYINELQRDVSSKYPVNDQVILAGFSGGSRMAISYAQYNAVDGVIACGALAAPEQISATNTLVYGIVGMGDFNFIEAAQYLFRPENGPENLRIEFTGNLHTWPSSEELSRLLGHIYFEKELSTRNCLNFISISNAYLSEQIAKTSDFISSADYVNAYMLIQNLAHIDVLNNSQEFIEIYNSVDYDGELNNQLNLLRESIRFELQVRDSYYKELAAKDIAWWKQEINSLNNHRRTEKNRYKALAYTRIKAFLGIMCYTLTNNALQNNDLQTASRLLPVYAYLEPENPDMFYFHALFSKVTENPNETKKNLQKALDAGFSDEEKIEALKSGL